jgi:hypothetical protein
MQDPEKVIRAASDSLHNVVSIRDFMVAVQVGAETAVTMLDEIERKLLESIRALDEDFDR